MNKSTRIAKLKGRLKLIAGRNVRSPEYKVSDEEMLGVILAQADLPTDQALDGLGTPTLRKLYTLAGNLFGCSDVGLWRLVHGEDAEPVSAEAPSHTEEKGPPVVTHPITGERVLRAPVVWEAHRAEGSLIVTTARPATESETLADTARRLEVAERMAAEAGVSLTHALGDVRVRAVGRRHRGWRVVYVAQDGSGARRGDRCSRCGETTGR